MPGDKYSLRIFRQEFFDLRVLIAESEIIITVSMRIIQRLVHDNENRLSALSLLQLFFQPLQLCICQPCIVLC